MQKTALYKALGLAFGAVLLTACANKGDVSEGAGNTATAPTATEQQAQEQQTNAVADAALVGQEQQAQASEAQAALLEETVFYFGFDQSSLTSEAKAALKAHAAYLASSSSARVVLEGHADERGSVEYNLALGERRAITVRRFLMANGASASQLQVVSFGEERPASLAHNEASWAKNRRVEVKYQSR